MKWRKRLEITLETSRLVLRRSNNQTTVWCLACSSPVQSVSPEEAAWLAGVNTRTVYRWVEAEQLHFIETAEKTSLICLNSPLRLTDQRGKNHVTNQIDHHNHD
jgi:hypothetical protein